MKNESKGKMITKFAATDPKTYGFRVQKDEHEIEESKFVKAKGVEKSVVYTEAIQDRHKSEPQNFKPIFTLIFSHFFTIKAQNLSQFSF